MKMKIRTFVMIAAIVAFLFALGFLLVPDTVMGFYGIQLNESERFICRYFGSALFGLSVTWWVTRKARDLNETMIGVMLGAASVSITGFLVALWDALYGPANELVWINPVIYILLSIGFVYFYIRKKWD
jgi:hypothetical protein